MPRLLLLQPGAEPPVCPDPLEDWIRVPAAPEDVRARAESLNARYEGRGHADIILDSGGLLRFGEGLTRLTPLQARLVAPLVERKGTVVSRTELIEAGWGSDQTGTSPNAVEANLVRLRRRLEPLGLRIRTIRSRGYLLEVSEHHAQ
jgi:two-component system OmpR family response regulator